MTGITVYGAGAFGTALAISLARAGRDVSLVARTREAAEKINAKRENASRLPGAPLPENLRVTADPKTVDPVCLLAVPTQKLAAFVDEHSAALADRHLVACCKGVEILTGKGPTGIIADHCPGAHTAILSGPSFAIDIAAGLPTALTIAAQDETAVTMLQKELSTATLRLYRSTDVCGVELGGALKNIIAIAAGVTIGTGLGESARAALMTRGYAEMLRFAAAYGAQPETLSGLSGFGDLVLTCTSDKSRNFSFGQSLGQRSDAVQTATVEGRSTAIAVAALAENQGIDMPLTRVVAALVEQKLSVSEAVKLLMSRPLKAE